MKKMLFFLLSLTAALSLSAQDQLYNMSMDNWTKKSGTWYPRAENATAAQTIWDSANKGMSIIGANCTTPEYKHVAVAGEGKAAAKIESRSVFGVFVAGNLFTGAYGKTVGTSGAVLNFGTPFTQRPRSLSGWYHYSPKAINYAKGAHKDKKGQTDQATIEVTLTDWSKPLTIDTTKEKFIDGKTNPHAIGCGEPFEQLGMAAGILGREAHVRVDVVVLGEHVEVEPGLALERELEPELGEVASRAASRERLMGELRAIP